MDVLAGHIEFQLAAVQVGEDVLQTGDQRICVIIRDDALLCQHGRVGHRAGDVLAVHTAVEGYGRVKIVCDLFDRTVCPSGPHFCHWDTSL